MFVSTRNQGYTRRNRVYKHRSVSFSHISLLSRLTVSSSGSGDSARTITQQSFDQLQRGHVKAKHSHKSRKTRKPKNPEMQSPPNAVTQADSTSKDVDVFEFLDQDQVDPSHAVTPFRQRRCDPARRLSAHEHEESDKESVARSLFSDSGISLNDSTTTASSQAFPKTRLETLPEYNNAQPMEEGPDKRGGHPFDPYLAGWPGYRVHHFGDGSPQHRTRTNLERIARERHDSGSVSPNNRRALRDVPTAVIASGHPTASGYNLLASRLSQPTEHEEALPPVYRKFTKLNHRILLQLQDEIAEMEEDLERLDREDNQLRHQPNGVTLPDSRRTSWSWLGSELQARRLDLLGKIYIKVEQYSKWITGCSGKTADLLQIKQLP
jgi:hypothetical protein